MIVLSFRILNILSKKKKKDFRSLFVYENREKRIFSCSKLLKESSFKLKDSQVNNLKLSEDSF